MFNLQTNKIDADKTANLLKTTSKRTGTLITTLNTNYWEGDPVIYSGRDLDVSQLEEFSSDLKVEILNNAANFLLKGKYKSGYLYSEMLKIYLCVTVFHKSILATPLDAIKLLSQYKDSLSASLESVKTHHYTYPEFFEAALLYGFQKTFQNRNLTNQKYLNICCPPPSIFGEGNIVQFFKHLFRSNSLPSFHDALGHYSVDYISGNMDRPVMFPTQSRLQSGRLLSVHFIFGNILPVLFLEGYRQGLNRAQILEYLETNLVSYFKAEKALFTKHGKLVELKSPITTQEIQENLIFSASEVEVSRYEPLIFTRFRRESLVYEDALMINYQDVNIIERLNELANLGATNQTVYQDSFYIRDQAIQNALKSV